MPARFREKFNTFTDQHYNPDYTNTPIPGTNRYEFFSDSVPGPCECLHVRMKPVVQSYQGSSPSMMRYKSTGQCFLPKSSSVTPTSSIEAMDWEKLPSSTQTGIIQILAELDDTVAIFTKKFWQSLTYGSFTWGVMPFVSDLIAVVNAVDNLSVKLNDFSYEDQFSIDLPPDPDLNWDYNHWDGGTMVVRYTGRADMSFQSPGSIALDWLGFHPDLATAWDLIPFSFVADYLLPIGDYLEQFRGGGWVKVVNFVGWQTIKTTGTLSYVFKDPGYSSSGTWPYRAFQRRYGGFTLTVDVEPKFGEFEFPSLKELFNMLYLLFA